MRAWRLAGLFDHFSQLFVAAYYGAYSQKRALWRGCTVTNDVPRDSKDRKWGTEARGVMANRKTFDAVYLTLAKRKLV